MIIHRARCGRLSSMLVLDKLQSFDNKVGPCVLHSEANEVQSASLTFAHPLLRLCEVQTNFVSSPDYLHLDLQLQT